MKPNNLAPSRNADMDTASRSSTKPSLGAGMGPIVSPVPCGMTVPLAEPNTKNLNAVPSSNVHRKRTAIFIQDDCLKHRYIRSRNTSGIYERPERLHAVKLGLAAAIAHIESVESSTAISKPVSPDTDEGDLAATLARMAIDGPSSSSQSSSSPLRTASVAIRKTSSSISLRDHAAVKFVHGDIDGDVYLENLVTWARDSVKNISNKGSEIPEGIPPLDLYLCPGSIDAIQGAVGAVCEAIDASVMATRGSQPPSRGHDDPCERAFVAIRPPGHHCGEDTPSGFCFINNVAVGAAHAHLTHGIQRIVILDIDLHHGNGTQSIVWQINEETYRRGLDLPQRGALSRKEGPQLFYGSLHDILSFPCEDGDPGLVQAASTSIHGLHGQYIENIHLQVYDSDAQFWDVLFPRYLTLLHRARNFLDETGGPGDDVIIFISCGFDAGEHEYQSMSRHDRKVPVGFYHRFTRETCKLADVYACGRVVSVLEGGYKDRALVSGAMGHLCGLVDVPSESDDWVDPTWWSQGNLVRLEKAVKPRKPASARASTEEWLARTLGLLSVLDTGPNANISDTGTNMSAPPSTSMTLRGRKKPVLDGARADDRVPDWVRVNKTVARSVSTSEKSSVERNIDATGATVTSPSLAEASGSDRGSVDSRREVSSGGTDGKKLPRVILHVRPPDTVI